MRGGARRPDVRVRGAGRGGGGVELFVAYVYVYCLTISLKVDRLVCFFYNIGGANAIARLNLYTYVLKLTFMSNALRCQDDK